MPSPGLIVASDQRLRCIFRAGSGRGANALIAGWHRSIAPQALSIEGNAVANLALGVASLTLRAVH
jgi:hypothetical protein